MSQFLKGPDGRLFGVGLFIVMLSAALASVLLIELAPLKSGGPMLLTGERLLRVGLLGTVALTGVAFLANYLGLFANRKALSRSSRTDTNIEPEELYSMMRELRNYLSHPRSSNAAPAQINIDADFKAQLVARLTTENQNALKQFVEGEIFKKAADNNVRQVESQNLARGLESDIDTYQLTSASWQRNANVNLIIGLVCAVAGIGVMWQTLVLVSYDVPKSDWTTNLYHIISRFGLVLIIESVAFFFLKLYREDRAMIRYFRNEITNLESKAAALKAALTFGAATDLTKVIQVLAGTERNFLLKKGDRVISELPYENSDILIEKMIGRPDLLEKIAKLVPAK